MVHEALSNISGSMLTHKLHIHKYVRHDVKHKASLKHRQIKLSISGGSCTLDEKMRERYVIENMNTIGLFMYRPQPLMTWLHKKP